LIHRGRARHRPGGDAAARSASKLTTARLLDGTTATSSLGPCWRSARSTSQVRQTANRDGNVADPATLANQVKKLKDRFALEHVVLVGDRGMITEARIEEVPPGSTGSPRCGRPAGQRARALKSST
jgi:hypothetical protein